MGNVTDRQIMRDVERVTFEFIDQYSMIYDEGKKVSVNNMREDSIYKKYIASESEIQRTIGGKFNEMNLTTCVKISKIIDLLDGNVTHNQIFLDGVLEYVVFQYNPMIFAEIKGDWPIFNNPPTPYAVQDFHIFDINLQLEDYAHANIVLYEKMGNHSVVSIYEPSGSDKIDDTVLKFADRLAHKTKSKLISVSYDGLQHLIEDDHGYCKSITIFMIFNMLILRKFNTGKFIGELMLDVEKFWLQRFSIIQLKNLITLFTSALNHVSTHGYIIDRFGHDTQLNPCYTIDDMKMVKMMEDTPPSTFSTPTDEEIEEKLRNYKLRPDFEVSLYSESIPVNSMLYGNRNFVEFIDSNNHVLLINPELEKITHTPRSFPTPIFPCFKKIIMNRSGIYASIGKVFYHIYSYCDDKVHAPYGELLVNKKGVKNICESTNYIYIQIHTKLYRKRKNGPMKPSNKTVFYPVKYKSVQLKGKKSKIPTLELICECKSHITVVNDILFTNKWMLSEDMIRYSMTMKSMIPVNEYYYVKGYSLYFKEKLITKFSHKPILLFYGEKMVVHYNSKYVFIEGKGCRIFTNFYSVSYVSFHKGRWWLYMSKYKQPLLLIRLNKKFKIGKVYKCEYPMWSIPISGYAPIEEEQLRIRYCKLPS